MPLAGASMTCSIFMASITRIGCPRTHRVALARLEADDRALHRRARPRRCRRARPRGGAAGTRPGRGCRGAGARRRLAVGEDGERVARVDLRCRGSLLDRLGERKIERRAPRRTRCRMRSGGEVGLPQEPLQKRKVQCARPRCASSPRARGADNDIGEARQAYEKVGTENKRNASFLWCVTNGKSRTSARNSYFNCRDAWSKQKKVRL